MPKLITQTRLRKALKKVIIPQTGWMDVFDAYTGRADGTVLTGVPGVVYVREALNGQVLSVYNGVVSSRPNVLVEVGRRVDQPGLWRIKGEKQVFSSPSTGPEVGFHHEQHEFPGGDTVWVDRKQYKPLTVLVSDAANFIVTLYGAAKPTANGLIEISTQEIDLSAYVVTAGAKFIAIETDDDGAISINEGSVFESPLVRTVADAPVPAAGKYTRAWVLFYEGQTQLSNDDIIVPEPPDFNPASDMAAAIHAASASAVTDNDEFGFWEDVADALSKITWANIKATLKTYFDTLYSAIGHSHSIPTQEDIEDIAGAMVSGNTETGIAVTYDDTGGKLNFDAQTAGDARYAPIAKGVTNGDTHDHNGGDGANIDTILGNLNLAGDISPTQITSNQNDYNPTGLSTASTLRLSSDAVRSITGLAGGADGRVIIIHNIGSYDIILAHESTLSAEGNRFTLLATDNLYIPSSGNCMLRYDATSSRWRVVATDLDAGFYDSEGLPANNGTASAGISKHPSRRDHVHAGDCIYEDDKLLASDGTFDFTSIPATGNYIEIIFDARSDRASNNSDGAKIKFNNDGGNNYVGVIQWGSATPGWTQQNTAGAPTLFAYVGAATSTANWFSNSRIIIPNYISTSHFKSWQARGMQLVASGANVWIYDAAGSWLSTNEISRVTLYPETGTNFKAGSRATLKVYL